MRSVAVLSLALFATTAHADGERTPMFGGAVIGVHSADQQELAGVQGELGMWFGRLGFALEGSQRWDTASGDPTQVTFGGSARLLVLDQLFQSALEPRDVELGLEFHAIVERQWQEIGANNQYGFGLALRLRGGGDAEFSTLLAESRLFVRVMSAREDRMEVVARDISTPGVSSHERGTTVLIGLGAAWGRGDRRYVDRFRLKPLDTKIELSPLLPQN